MINIWGLRKSAYFLGNFARGFLDGTVDEVKHTFTDAEITKFSDTGKTLNNCEPWSDHLKRDSYYEINQALKKNNYNAAREAVDKYATETADPSCITALKTALVDVCTKCTTLIREALPNGIVVPKEPK